MMMQDSVLENSQQYLQEDLRFGADSDLGNVGIVDRYATEDDPRHHFDARYLKGDDHHNVEPFPNMSETAARAAEALSLSLPPHPNPNFGYGHYDNDSHSNSLHALQAHTHHGHHHHHHLDYHSSSNSSAASRAAAAAAAAAHSLYFPVGMAAMIPPHSLTGSSRESDHGDEYNDPLLGDGSNWGDHSAAIAAAGSLRTRPTTARGMVSSSFVPDDNLSGPSETQVSASTKKGNSSRSKRGANNRNRGSTSSIGNGTGMVGAAAPAEGAVGLATGSSSTVTTANTSPSHVFSSQDAMTSNTNISAAPLIMNGGGRPKRGGERDPGPPGETPDEKRRRFLERNRMAASKCRAKKKQWMQELEHKSSEIFQRNRDLTLLVSSLKDEISALKTRLVMYENQCTCNVVHQYAPRDN